MNGTIKEKTMKGVWPADLGQTMNLTLAFSLDLRAETEGILEMAASSFYKIYVDGQFLAFGPQRAAHGYARKAEYHICARI